MLNNKHKWYNSVGYQYSKIVIQATILDKTQSDHILLIIKAEIQEIPKCLFTFSCNCLYEFGWSRRLTLLMSHHICTSQNSWIFPYMTHIYNIFALHLIKLQCFNFVLQLQIEYYTYWPVSISCSCACSCYIMGLLHNRRYAFSMTHYFLAWCTFLLCRSLFL